MTKPHTQGHFRAERTSYKGKPCIILKISRRRVVKKSFFKIDYESFEEVLATANAWIRDRKIEVLNIETVVLPNMGSGGGNTDIVHTSSQSDSFWY